MAHLLVATGLRYFLSKPKKRAPMATRQPGDPEAQAGAVVEANNANALTPEEMKEKKKKKIIRIVTIVGVLFVLCWAFNIPVVPMLKQALKSLEGKHDGGNGTDTGGGGGIDFGKTLSLVFGSV